jgi:hypothetical protein
LDILSLYEIVFLAANNLLLAGNSSKIHLMSPEKIKSRALKPIHVADQQRLYSDLRRAFPNHINPALKDTISDRVARTRKKYKQGHNSKEITNEVAGFIVGNGRPPKEHIQKPLPPSPIPDDATPREKVILSIIDENPELNYEQIFVEAKRRGV